MKAWGLGLALALVGCGDATAPTVDCQGALEVTIRVTRLGADTTVVCAFPRDTLPPEPPDDDCDDDHGHGHGRHHRYGHHDHPRGHR